VSRLGDLDYEHVDQQQDRLHRWAAESARLIRTLSQNPHSRGFCFTLAADGTQVIEFNVT